MLAYWWRDIPNFGDRLTPLLLQHFLNRKVTWSDVKTAQIVGTGSLLEHIPSDYTGIIAGSGMLGDGRPIVANGFATWLGTRGPLSAAYAPNPNAVCIGDPGLLACDLLPEPVRKTIDLGILPHWSDTHLAHDHRFQQWSPHIISAWDDPIDVIYQIAACRKLVTSSLHGLIVADSFGIPRRFEYTKNLDNQGGDFKFRDYYASIGMKFKVGETQVANYNTIIDRQSEIYDMIQEIPCFL